MTAATTNLRMQALQLAQDLDPALLTADAAMAVVEDLAVADKAIATALVFAAVKVAKTDLWRGKGHATAADWLAAQLGVSVRQAGQYLSTGRRADRHPKTKDAMRKGKVSPSQADAITDAADADPDAEDELLDTAERDTNANLKAKADRVKAAATDERQKAARIRRERSRWSRTNADGSFDLHLHGPAADLVRIEAQLRPWDEEIFRTARPNPDGTRDTFANRAYDAAVACFTRQHHDPTTTTTGNAASGSGGGGEGTAPVKAPGGNNTKVIVRVDHSALLRGHTLAGETCDIAGLGPLPVSAVRDLLADAFLAVIVTKGRDVHTVAHHGRGLDAHQRTAIEWTGTICSNIACNHTIATQMDHNLPWAQDPRTKLDNIDPLCPTCHRHKTHHGWHLEPGTGRRRFLPPDHADGPSPGADPPPTDPPAADGAGDLNDAPGWRQPTLC